MTPNAGPSSPSPAELAELADTIQRIAELLSDMDLEAVEAEVFIDTLTEPLSALVQSVEERTLREAAKAMCSWCRTDEAGEPKRKLNGEWMHELRPPTFVASRVWCTAGVVRSRLASLKDTRER